MTSQAELHALAVKVGEISGQMRELIHQQNNMAQKIDGMTERQFTAPTGAEIDEIKRRVSLLEAEKNRSDGAKGVFAALMKSPVAAWAAALIAALYGAIKGGILK